MKKLIFIIFTFISFNLLADEIEDQDPDLVSNNLEACLANASDIKNKRLCITNCYNEARNTVEGNMCAYEGSELEKKNYESVYAKAIAAAKEEIENADEFSMEDAKETLARYEAYNANLLTYMDARCRVEALLMLGGTGETSIYVGCTASVYKESAELIQGEEY